MILEWLQPADKRWRRGGPTETFHLIPGPLYCCAYTVHTCTQVCLSCGKAKAAQALSSDGNWLLIVLLCRHRQGAWWLRDAVYLLVHEFKSCLVVLTVCSWHAPYMCVCVVGAMSQSIFSWLADTLTIQFKKSCHYDFIDWIVAYVYRNLFNKCSIC